MIYYIYNREKDILYKFNSWNELIKSFHDAFFYIDDIAHNENDTRTSVYGFHFKRVEKHLRVIYCYDEDFNIVNLYDIRKGLQEYIDKGYQHHSKRWRWIKKKYHLRYRKDPIPYTGRGHYKGYWRKAKKHKNYYAKLQEFVSEDSRLRKQFASVSKWGDEFSCNKEGKSWKKKKIRKQWMK